MKETIWEKTLFTFNAGGRSVLDHDIKNNYIDTLRWWQVTLLGMCHLNLDWDLKLSRKDL